MNRSEPGEVSVAGYQAVVDEIKASGEAAGRLAERLQGVDIAGTVPNGDCGMPGARSQGLLGDAGQAMHQHKTWIAEKAVQYADDLRSAAWYYRMNEDAAKRDLTALGAPLAGGR